MSDFWSQLALDRIGFALAAAGYLFFFALLLTVKVRNVPRSLLLACSLATACWALSYATLNMQQYSMFFLWMENAKLLFTLLFLYSALQTSQNSLQAFFKRKAVWISSVLMLAWTLAAQTSVLSLSILINAQLLLTIYLLALLEALYRKSAAERWQFKPLIFALSICLLFDFVLLAEAALFSRIDTELWAARGFVHVLMVPLLIISVRRIKSWNIRVYISRDIVLQSTLVMVAGAYLLLLALAGFYIRYSGNVWSQLLQAIFVVLGFAIFATLVMSDGIRRRLKVFIEKNFFENTFDYRVKWLELTHSLRQIDVNTHQVYSECLAIWLSSIGYTKGALIRFDKQQINALALYNRPALSLTEQQMIAHYSQQFSNSHWIVDLNQKNDNFSQQLAVNIDNKHTQLIIPIQSKGQLWGLCLMQAEPHLQLKLNWELRDYLIAVTEQIASYVFLVEASHKLSENAQFAAFSQMSAFVVHDLKNVKAQVDLILKNAEKHANNPEFIQDTFDTLAAMQHRMQNMLSQLSSKRIHQQQQRYLSVALIARQVIEQRCANRSPLPSLTVIKDAELLVDKERFASVLYHLLDNAQQACQPEDVVSLTINADHHNVFLGISDTGCGMSADFIAQRLFKPFDSTKGNAGMGIGAFDAKQFAEQSGGTLNVKSIPSKGTTFTLTLPLNLLPGQELPALTAVQGM